jgi:DNA-binding winged helix-turn-helix (wHTH) protein/tetratricopeptide (TPR) repeat protein
MKPTSHTETAIAFAPFVLDVRGERLLRGTESIALRPKTWAVLRYLAERPGVLVTKDELFSEIWPGTAVGDDTLTKSIREIRDALGDHVKTPRYVETVHRRGFRFIAEISNGSSVISDQWSAANRSPDHPITEYSITDRSGLVTPFVGRAAELQQLTARFRRACDGQRQIAFVSGEPGIGKTALVEALLAALRTQHPMLFVGMGASVEQQGAREAYLPVLAALEQLAHNPDVEGLVPLMQRFAPTWLAQLPWLLEPADVKTLLDSLVDTRSERMLREFCAFVEALTRVQTLVLVLEDLHWSDPATVELLALLAQRRERARLLVIGTYRPAEAAVQEHPLLQTKQILQARRQCVDIPLHYLSAPEVHAYLEKRLLGYDRPQELARLIHEHTDGSPLFMIAVLDDLIARGWLVDTAPGWALTVPLAKADLGVPDDMREMIAIHLHALSPSDQALLEAASVAGVEFAATPVAAGLDVGLEDAESACERLSRLHRFLRVVGSMEWPPDGAARRYGFIHALYRQIVYEGIPEGRRQRLHQRIGEALETAYGSHAPNIATELAVHFECGRDALRTIKYLAHAALNAQRRFAPREAVTALERALELTERLPDAQARRRHELELRVLLSSPLGSLHGYAAEAAQRNYEQVLALSEEVGTPNDQYGALYALWHCQASRAEMGLVETAERMEQLAQTIGDAEMCAQADVILGRTRFWQGRFVDARDVLERTLDFWNRQPGKMEGPALLEPPGIAVYFYSAVVLWFLGYPDRARAHLRDAMGVTEPVAHPFVLAGSFVHAAYITHPWRDGPEVESLARRAIALADEHDFPFWKGFGVALLGWALAQQGQAKEGAELIREGLTLHRATGAQIICSHILCFLADAYLRLGNVTAGLRAAEEALTLCESTCDHVYEPELWRLKGQLLMQQVEHRRSAAEGKKRRPKSVVGPTTIQAAETCLQRALDLAHTRQAKSLELRAAMDLARLWSGQGRRAAARTLLEDVYGWFTEGFDTPDLRDAAALIATLSGTG